MRFIKCIFSKIQHGIIDLICHPLRLLGCITDPVSYASGNIPLLPFAHLISVTVDKGMTAGIDLVLMLFTHGPSHNIRLSQGVSCQLLHDLHYLLLVDDTAIGIL